MLNNCENKKKYICVHIWKISVWLCLSYFDNIVQLWEYWMATFWYSYNKCVLNNCNISLNTNFEKFLEIYLVQYILCVQYILYIVEHCIPNLSLKHNAIHSFGINLMNSQAIWCAENIQHLFTSEVTNHSVVCET